MAASVGCPDADSVYLPMRAVIQRVRSATVTVDDETVGSAGAGILVLLGVAHGDGPADVLALARKTAELRIFPDDAGRMNRSLVEVGGSALVVSQFTLMADVRRGRRPSFTSAADPAVAEPLVTAFAEALRERGIATDTGEFGAMMDVALVNDGPVTIVIEARGGSVL